MSGDAEAHVPVLVDELLEAVVVDASGLYVDCTFGRGGHARALLGVLSAEARVLGIDRDASAVEAGRRLEREDARFTMVHGRFGDLARIAGSHRVSANGVIFDLGVSSPQLDAPERGFSFLRDGPLNMRMDATSGVSAAQWIRTASEAEIEQVLRDFGEERHARRIARRIVAARAESPIETTGRLADVVARAIPGARSRRDPGQHPATRVFQAIRIRVNDELGELAAGLEQALDVLEIGGRLAVISFHSLEDRMVKRFLRDRSRPPLPSRHVPLHDARPQPRLTGVTGPIVAGAEEIARNPRARSARLRYAEKCR